MLLQVLVAREPEVGDAAVCKRTDEWPIVPVEVLVAGFGVAEAFMEVETREFRAFEGRGAVVLTEVRVRSAKVFDEFAIASQGFCKRFDANIIPCFPVFLLMFQNVIPYVD